MKRSLAVTASLILCGSLANRADSPQPNVPVETRLKCSGPGYTAKYSPAANRIPPTVDVTYRGARPTSAAAQQVLTKCMREVADSMFITDEVLGTVWFGKSTNDDEIIALTDGSDHLTYNPKTKRLVTWNERDGKKPEELIHANGYMVKFEQNKTSVPPFAPYATVTVVFPSVPTEKRAYEAVITEATKAVRQTKSSMPVSVFAESGNSNNPASWKQVRGTNGKFISAEFNPKKPGKLFGSDGSDVGVQIR